MHFAGAAPVLWEEGHCIRHDLDHFAGFVPVGAAAEQEVAEFVTGHMAVPITRRADPDAGFALPIEALEDHHAAGARLPFDHGGDDAPVLERAFVAFGIFQMRGGGGEAHFYLNM